MTGKLPGWGRRHFVFLQGFLRLNGKGPDPEPGLRVDWQRFNGGGLRAGRCRGNRRSQAQRESQLLDERQRASVRASGRQTQAE